MDYLIDFPPLLREKRTENVSVEINFPAGTMTLCFNASGEIVY